MLYRIFSTNNIVEAINSCINFYLPKKAINNLDFINKIGKYFLINQKFKESDIKRKDYITSSLIFFID